MTGYLSVVLQKGIGAYNDWVFVCCITEGYRRLHMTGYLYVVLQKGIGAFMTGYLCVVLQEGIGAYT